MDSYINELTENSVFESIDDEQIEEDEIGNHQTIEFIKVEYVSNSNDDGFVNETEHYETIITDESDHKPESLQEPESIKERKIVKSARTLSEKSSLDLIKAVKQKPELWHKRNPSYKCAVAQNEAWASLSVALGVPAVELKKKWQHLRNMFRKNIYLVKQSRLSNGEGRKEFQPTWFGYGPMQFLRQNNDVDVDVRKRRSFALRSQVLTPAEKASLELIKAVKQKPELWQKSCPSYKCATAQNDAWKTLSDVFGVPVADIKEKWQNLRAMFRKNLRKVIQSQETGLGKHVYKPVWFGYGPMQFLRGNNDNDDSEDVPETSIQQDMSASNKSIALSKEISSSPLERKRPASNYASSATKFPRRSVSPDRGSSVQFTVEPNETILQSPAVSRIKLSNTRQNSVTSSRISKAEPMILTALENITKITNTFMQTRASPYSGYLAHLSSMLGRKHPHDFDQIEAILLKCMNDLSKFPNMPDGTLSNDIDIDDGSEHIDSEHSSL